MAKTPKTEGQKVREAFDGPQLDPDKFLERHYAIAAQEQSSASDAGTRRQQIGELFDSMSLESKAASQARAILKMKNDGKKRDAVRSWEQLLPMLQREVLGGTEDMFPSNGGPEITNLTAKEVLERHANYPPKLGAPTGADADDPEAEEFNKSVDDATK